MQLAKLEEKLYALLGTTSKRSMFFESGEESESIQQW
jgi:hypothetical protein